MNLDPDERAILAALADELIPAGDGRASASQAEVAGKWLDQVLAARPDLAKPLKNLLLRARGRNAREFVAELRSSDVAAFGVLAEVVPGAYFMSPSVQQSLGYIGQTPKTIDPTPDYLQDGLLDSVIARGPIYRPTP